MLSDKELRECFHLLFLENLRRSTADPRLYVLKGGVNLRFFFRSPRYSEDMDLDVLGGSVMTLKKNGYKILESPSFRRTLATYGIQDIKINDPAKAKQTETTQRFRVRLVNQAGEEFPTKVEFSRRSEGDDFMEENIDPDVAARYKRLSFHFQHYPGTTAAAQKIRALAGRPTTQARDVFDLYILFLGHQLKKDQWKLSRQTIDQACESALSISYEQYRDQVEEYLTSDGRREFGGASRWAEIQARTVDEIA
jgi:predicted nucleotidyltransferase component of viral defense system